MPTVGWMISKCLTLTACVAALMAVVLGLLLFSSVPTQLGLYRWWAQQDPMLLGLTPAYHYGIPWRYNFTDFTTTTNLTGQYAIVTGANTGIGYQLAMALALQGADVTLACRNMTKCQAAAEKIRVILNKNNTTTTTSNNNNDNNNDSTLRKDDSAAIVVVSSAVSALRMQPGTITPMLLDTSSLSSVQAFAHNYQDYRKQQLRQRKERRRGGSTHQEPALDMLFLNAGTYYGNLSSSCVPLSEENDLELLFVTNYLGHHLLYRLLEPLLQRAPVARVVQTSSSASFRSYSYHIATDLETLNGCLEPFVSKETGEHLSYGQSKLAQVVWVKALTHRLGPNSTIYVNAFHPGMVDTHIWDNALAEYYYNDKNNNDDAGETTVSSSSSSSSSLARKWQPWKQLLEWSRTHRIMWTPAEGALTGLFLGAAVPQVVEQNIRGQYYHPQSQPVAHVLADNETLQQELWNFSELLVQAFLPVANANATDRSWYPSLLTTFAQS